MQSGVIGLIWTILLVEDGDGRWMISQRSVERGVHSIGKFVSLPAVMGNSKPVDPCVVMEKVGKWICNLFCSPMILQLI